MRPYAVPASEMGCNAGFTTGFRTGWFPMIMHGPLLAVNNTGNNMKSAPAFT